METVGHALQDARALGLLVHVDIESNDVGGGDQDFDDLILTCTMAQSGSDFVIYGHATAYSGVCLLNPCFRLSVVIDSASQLVLALKNPIVRAAVEKLYPEVVLPGPKNPPDPGPLRSFIPLMLPTPRSPALPPKLLQVTRTREASSTRQLVTARSAPPSLLDSALTTKLGTLLEGALRPPLRCHTTTLGNYGLRFQEYDRTAAELSGGAYTGTGDREDLGTTATDPFGNYLFRFSRSVSEIIEEGLTDVAIGEDATVQALPDVIAQVLGAGQLPAAETACHFNVQTLQRIDICVPDVNIVLPSSCADNRILTFIGKISLTSSLNSLDATGRITAASSAGNAPKIDCGIWWRTSICGVASATRRSLVTPCDRVRWAADLAPGSFMPRRNGGRWAAAPRRRSARSSIWRWPCHSTRAPQRSRVHAISTPRSTRRSCNQAHS